MNRLWSNFSIVLKFLSTARKIFFPILICKFVVIPGVAAADESQIVCSDLFSDRVEDKASLFSTQELQFIQDEAVQLAESKKLQFIKVEAGEFERHNHWTELTEPVEVAERLLTHDVWSQVIDSAVARFSPNDDALQALSTTKGFLDHQPVEGISYNEVILWFSVLNDLVAEEDPIVGELMAGHVPGSFYFLGTEAQWDRARQTSTSMQTSDQLREFLNDWWAYDLEGGLDPQGPFQGDRRVVRGEGVLGHEWRDAVDPSARVDGISFRVFRMTP